MSILRDLDWMDILQSAFTGLGPALQPLLVILAFVVAVNTPMPGRGPRLLQSRDPWRTFKHEARRVVMERAGNRCEGSVFLVFGRCGDPAVEADHVYPWSRGGPTTPSNGQALCRGHNRNKGAWKPGWWYLLALERRRRRYFPPGSDIRVVATMAAQELEARAAAATGRASRGTPPPGTAV